VVHGGVGAREQIFGAASAGFPYRDADARADTDLLLSDLKTLAEHGLNAFCDVQSILGFPQLLQKHGELIRGEPGGEVIRTPPKASSKP
jgi:hypothetical protein